MVCIFYHQLGSVEHLVRDCVLRQPLQEAPVAGFCWRLAAAQEVARAATLAAVDVWWCGPRRRAGAQRQRGRTVAGGRTLSRSTCTPKRTTRRVPSATHWWALRDDVDGSGIPALTMGAKGGACQVSLSVWTRRTPVAVEASQPSRRETGLETEKRKKKAETGREVHTTKAKTKNKASMSADTPTIGMRTGSCVIAELKQFVLEINGGVAAGGHIFHKCIHLREGDEYLGDVLGSAKESTMWSPWTQRIGSRHLSTTNHAVCGRDPGISDDHQLTSLTMSAMTAPAAQAAIGRRRNNEPRRLFPRGNVCGSFRGGGVH